MRRRMLLTGACAVGVTLAFAAEATAASADAALPWMNVRLDPDRRAELALKAMTFDEQIALLHGVFPLSMHPPPPGVQISAGYIAGIPRLKIPALRESDASLGVANAGRGDTDDAAALPSGLMLASTFSPDLAFRGGAMIGKEARQKGFNVLLAGGANLARDPRNGRNFEYLGEDPLLAGTLDAASIRGIQSQHVVSTAKHFVLNDQETGRQILSANIGDAAARESDLLAFEIALGKGDPGSVMCSYNRINSVYACENGPLLTGVLRQDWGWRGWTMSDWGAVHSLKSAAAGLDQESGAQLDDQVFFDKPLKAAVASGEVSKARVHQMAHRVLRAMFAEGLVDHPLQPGGLDPARDAEVSGAVAEQGVVLLKNDGLLPLGAGARRIVVIGAHADVGVVSGGGSSQVIPRGSFRIPPPKGAPAWSAGRIYHPSSPLKAIQARARNATVTYDTGSDPAAAAALARDADVAIVFAEQWASEGMDTQLTLGDGQDALIEAVAAANPHTIVVLETGNPVLMPWAGKVGALLEAWYPGARGGEAIAKVLFGEVDPSGRLPISFPASAEQLPRPELPGARTSTPEGADGHAREPPFDVDYSEGSDVGYRWYARTGRRAAFPFGFGLSYTRFRYSGLKLIGGKTLTASFVVSNTGGKAGVDTPQVYLKQGPLRAQQRLIGWSRVALKPGESRRLTLAADPRLLANWDAQARRWRLEAGAYQIFVGTDAADSVLAGSAKVQGTTLAP